MNTDPENQELRDYTGKDMARAHKDGYETGFVSGVLAASVVLGLFMTLATLSGGLS